MEDARWFSFPRLGITLAAVAVYAVGLRVPLPGMDCSWRGAEGGVTGWLGLRPPTVSVFSFGISALLLVRGGAYIFSRLRTPAHPVRFHRMAFGLYLLLSALQAAHLVRFLADSDTVGVAPLIWMPPGQFVPLAVVTLVGASALLWGLAEWINRRGLGSGVLILSAAQGILNGEDLVRFGMEVARETPGLLPAVHAVHPLVSLVALAVVLALRYPAGWPAFFLKRLSVRSPLDVLCLPFAFALINPANTAFNVAASLLPASTPIDPLWLLWPPLFCVGLTLSFAMLWIRAVPFRGVRIKYLVLATLAPVVPVLLFGVGFAKAGGIEAMLSPSPFAGPDTYRVTLRPDGELVRADVALILERLEEMDFDAEILLESDDRLVLEIPGVGDIGGLMARAIERHTVTLRFVSEDQGPLTPNGSMPPPEVRIIRTLRFGPAPEERRWIERYVGPDAETLRPIMERGRASGVGLPYLECDHQQEAAPADRQTECTAILVESKAVITADHIESAKVMYDAPSNGGPRVSLRLNDIGTKRFAVETGDGVGRELAIIVDDELVSRPIVQAAITGGNVSVTLGSSSPEEGVAQARSLARSFNGARLHSPWRIEAVEKID